MCVFGVFSGSYFLHSDLIFGLLSRHARKYKPQKLRIRTLFTQCSTSASSDFSSLKILPIADILLKIFERYCEQNYFSNKNSKFYLIGFDACAKWQIIMSKISLSSWSKNKNTLPQSNLMVLIKIYLLCFFNQFLANAPILHPLKDVFRRCKMKA